MDRQLLQRRLDELVRRRAISSQQAERFGELELAIVTSLDDGDEELLSRFHDTNDTYLPLLERVLKGLVRIGEPLAGDKLDLFLEERGTMGPAVFLSPWEMTLDYLDEEFGELDRIADHYE